MSYSENNFTDYDYFKLRNPNKIYVSKEFPRKSFYGLIIEQSRVIRKVFEKSENNIFVKVDGEIVLKNTPRGRDQVSVIVTSESENNNKIKKITLQQFRNNPKNGLSPVDKFSFTFKQDEFIALLKFLSDVKFLDLTNKDNFQIQDNDEIEKIFNLWLEKPSDNNILVNKHDAHLIEVLKGISGAEREGILTSLKEKVFSHEDLNILTGRKEGLRIFKTELDKSEWTEKEWQSFFINNPWIFGYGLDYRFLSIIQDEASVSTPELDGKENVYTDFLMSDQRFTVLIELKRPDTPLFTSSKHRSKSWELSKDISNSVSQILSQKAEWEYKSKTKQHDQSGNVIQEKTIDPKTILIIGHTSQFQGDDKNSEIKAKTFELYRRNSRNIEIVTFNELYERASFIVNNKSDSPSPEDNSFDELPF
jgi:hypothetical protein